MLHQHGPEKAIGNPNDDNPGLEVIVFQGADTDHAGARVVEVAEGAFVVGHGYGFKGKGRGLLSLNVGFCILFGGKSSGTQIRRTFRTFS